MARGGHPHINPRDLLGLYADRAERLSRKRLARSESPYGTKLEFNTLGPIPYFAASSWEPDQDDLESYMGAFRQFFNQDEPIYQRKIYDLLYLCLTSEELRGYLIKSREAWQDALKGHGIITYTLNNADGTPIVDKRILTPEYVTNLWINEALHSYAREAEKRIILKHILPHERMLTRTTMLQFINEASQQIAYTWRIIVAALKEGVLDYSRAK